MPGRGLRRAPRQVSCKQGVMGRRFSAGAYVLHPHSLSTSSTSVLGIRYKCESSLATTMYSGAWPCGCTTGDRI